MTSRGIITSFGTGYRSAPNDAEAYGLWRHRIARSTKPPGVLFIGGYGTTADVWISPTFREQVDRAGAAGLPSLGADQGGPATWGNDAAKAAVGEMYSFLVGAGGANPSKKVAIVAGSMGCPVSLVWARENLDKVACIHLTIPAVDVEDIRANNRSGLQASIEAAYANNAGWQAARPTHNPIEYATELVGIPIRICYSTDDTICLPALVQSFASTVSAELVSLGAVGHVGTTQDFAAATAWLTAHLAV